MCGIAGIIGFGEEARKEEIERMTTAIAHRGPDGAGALLRGSVGLGHRRLSIIDLSQAAAQPMVSAGGRYAVTFNGEIYNFQEKRAMLEAAGHRFASSGDTEVLLKLFELHGERCVDHLHGMFAFAAADFERKEALLARDRIGKKPLYFFVNDRRLAFASEIKALRALPDCPREIDAEAVRHFLLLGYAPAPSTGIRGIQKLPAAHVLKVNWGQRNTLIQRYWSLPTEIDTEADHAKTVAALDAKISESVRLRLIADVPLGAFLSGGLDSSTVVAYMKRHAKQVTAFSIGFKGLRSEIPDAQAVAAHLGVESLTKELEPDVLGILPTLVRIYDEPFGDPSCIPTYFLCQHAREHATVALSGDGGDENFGGYARYPILHLSDRLACMPRFLTSVLRKGAQWAHVLRKDTFTYRSLLFAESLRKPWQLRMLDYMGNCTEHELRTLCRAPALLDARSTYRFFEEKTKSVTERARRDERINAAMQMDILTYLADDLMPKVDLAAMAHALEVRAPLLDHELMEMSARIPSAWKVRGFEKKLILKEIVSPMLPLQTLRKRKQGFRLPLDEWFRGKYREKIRARLLDGHPLAWTLLDRSGVERFWDGYMASRIDYSPQVFQLAWLQHWIEMAEG